MSRHRGEVRPSYWRMGHLGPPLNKPGGTTLDVITKGECAPLGTPRMARIVLEERKGEMGVRELPSGHSTGRSLRPYCSPLPVCSGLLSLRLNA